MVVQIQVRRDTTANWLASKAVLKEGEPALDTQLLTLKFGDGQTPYDQLPTAGKAITDALLAAIVPYQAANAAARDALFPAPAANNQVFRLDAGVVERYDGAAWRQINGVTSAVNQAAPTSIGAGGTAALTTAGVTLNAVPWARKVMVTGYALTTAFSGLICDITIRQDNIDQKTYRLTAGGSAMTYYSIILAPNITTSFQLVAVLGGTTTATVSNNSQYTGLYVDVVAM